MCVRIGCLMKTGGDPAVFCGFVLDIKGMIIMTEKEKRLQRQKAEDAVFNQMLLWLVGAVIAEAIVLFVRRFYINVTVNEIGILSALHTFFRVFIYAGALLTVLGIIWCWMARKNGKKLTLPVICTVAAAFIWITSLLTLFLDAAGVKVLMLLPIVVAVLVLIYFLYQRAFFVNAIFSGVGIAALWAYRQYYTAHPTVVTAGLVVGWIGLIVIAVLCWVLKKNGGKLGSRKLVSDQKCYPACWLTCAVILVTTVLALVLGVGIAYYLIYVMIGWLFCLAVYYTVKLM